MQFDDSRVFTPVLERELWEGFGTGGVCSARGMTSRRGMTLRRIWRQGGNAQKGYHN